MANVDVLQHLPEFLRGYRELSAIAKAENPELSQLWGYVDDALNDQFIATAGVDGLCRWERQFSVTPKGTDAIETRRFRLLAKRQQQLCTNLHQQLRALCGESGYTVSVSDATYTLTVKVELTVKGALSEATEFVRNVTPANMIIDVDLRYNTHAVVGLKTHAYLATKNHEQIRSEVI